MRQPNKILVVEDEVTFADNLREYLARNTGEVRVALDAASALQVAEDFLPDLVLLDYALGSDNGLTVLDRMRSSQPGCQALLMTAHPSDDIVREAGNRGVSAVLFKPFSFAELKEAMTHCQPMAEARVTETYFHERRVNDRRRCDLAETAPVRFLARMSGHREARQSRGRRLSDLLGSEED